MIDSSIPPSGDSDEAGNLVIDESEKKKAVKRKLQNLNISVSS